MIIEEISSFEVFSLCFYCSLLCSLFLSFIVIVAYILVVLLCSDISVLCLCMCSHYILLLLLKLFFHALLNDTTIFFSSLSNRFFPRHFFFVHTQSVLHSVIQYDVTWRSTNIRRSKPIFLCFLSSFLCASHYSISNNSLEILNSYIQHTMLLLFRRHIFKQIIRNSTRRWWVDGEETRKNCKIKIYVRGMKKFVGNIWENENVDWI